MDGVSGGDWTLSKRFKGKYCAYCGEPRASTTADHVIAREFFLKGDRGNLPKVPACIRCNNDKSKLEHYVTTALMLGSRHAEGARYRKEMVGPRLARNLKLGQEIGFFDPPTLVRADGIIQPMQVLKIDPNKLLPLMALITKGLYFYHFDKPLPQGWYAQVYLVHPDQEDEVLASVARSFPVGSTQVNGNFGHGSFLYEGLRSSSHDAHSIWWMAWHNGIPLYGQGSPPQGMSIYWCVTLPIDESEPML